MERWNDNFGTNRENKKIDAFLDEVIAVCRKHGLSMKLYRTSEYGLTTTVGELVAERPRAYGRTVLHVWR